MMVPRSFLFSSASSQKSAKQDAKECSPAPSTPRRSSSQLRENDPRLQFPTAISPDLPSVTHTSPVVIPPKRAPRRTPVTPNNRSRNTRNGYGTRIRSPSTNSDAKVPASVATLLEVTAIPLPRRSWSLRSSRKLPPGNHVEDFSRLLMEGLEPRDEGKTVIDGSASTTLDVLLSPPDSDNEKFMFGNDYEPGTPLSARSLSSDSTPSLDHDLDSYSPSVLPVTPPAISQKNPLERRLKQLSPVEECASDHPLLDVETIDPLDQVLVEADVLTPTSPSPAVSKRTFPRLSSTFKSNLTASLRAIKSAAQTVSNFATPSVQSEDFLTRSLFTIAPELTDDRRPRLMDEPPSAELRRYLNPINGSPAEMHVYHEPHDLPGASHKCPVSIQMQTYQRSGGKGEGGFSVVTADDGDAPFDPEIPPMARQREPRENSDFLRIVVLEMNMRRSGKLRDDIPTRARIWLPPRKVSTSQLSPNLYGTGENVVPQRWIGVSVGVYE
ncbi:hypothetical protein DTO271D3_4280 [Paecilomyces variotii]|nr:hypothetical protein DTO169C6_5385 [Paecilomyces variotii]KAJ9315403.1 hypothetical protein DTO271D3_4280 [Paecilomyces variotii]